MTTIDADPPVDPIRPTNAAGNSNSLSAITAPRKVVQDLYAKRACSLSDVAPRDFGVEAYFDELAKDEEVLKSIPIVTISTIDTIPNDTLVRCVGMVQDMFNPEYFVSEYKDRVSGSWVTTRYGDCSVQEDDGEDDCEHRTDFRRFDERHPVLLVPLPGQSNWVVERQENAATASVMRFGACRAHGKGKRALEAGDSMDVDGKRVVAVGSEADRHVDDGEAQNPLTLDGSGGGNALPETNSSVKASNLIPRGSCIVHLYNDTTIKLNDVVEVLGVISRVPELASGAMHGMEDEGMVASMVPTSVAPRIHAICVHTMDVARMALGTPLGFNMASVAPTLNITRESIVRFLAGALQGDALAAEYVLMQLISRVHRRTQGGVCGSAQDAQMQLGTAALNITGAVDGGDFAEGLSFALSQLMPAVVCLPLEIDALNRRPWYPAKVNNETNFGAVLQLPAGAVLVLDETAMSAGQLTETGLKNLGAIQTMMQSQKLPYDFQFYQLEQPTDQPIIISSIGRTMLKGAGEIQVVLPRGAPNRVQGGGGKNGFHGDVEAARRYLAAARSMSFSIPQALERQIENDMTDARKTDSANVNAETFHNWLNLARLLCLSHGESELSLVRWKQVLAMESERVKRIA